MIPYYCLVCVPLLVCLLENKHNIVFRKQDKVKYIQSIGISLFFIIYLLLLCLRNEECGIDLQNYKIYFNRYSKMDYSELLNSYWYYDVEIGFRFFIKIISTIKNEFRFFIVITSIVSILPLLFYYRKECVSAEITIALFMGIAPFSLYFSGIRQVIAMGFVFPALYFTRRKKIIPFILMVLIASTFHQSAMILLLLYPIFRARITKKWLYYIVPLMVIIFIFNNNIFNTLLGFLVNTSYEMYAMTRTGAYGMLVMFILLSIFLYVITVNNESNLSADDIGYRNIILLATCLQFFVPLSTVAMRMNYYFIILLPIGIPKLLKKRDPKYSQVVRFASIILTLFFLVRYFVGMYTTSDVLNIYPYLSMWS